MRRVQSISCFSLHSWFQLPSSNGRRSDRDTLYTRAACWFKKNCLLEIRMSLTNVYLTHWFWNFCVQLWILSEEHELICACTVSCKSEYIRRSIGVFLCTCILDQCLQYWINDTMNTVDIRMLFWSLKVFVISPFCRNRWRFFFNENLGQISYSIHCQSNLGTIDVSSGRGIDLVSRRRRTDWRICRWICWRSCRRIWWRIRWGTCRAPGRGSIWVGLTRCRNHVETCACQSGTSE